MTDCLLAGAVRSNALTPSGRTGDEIASLLLRKIRDVHASRPWLLQVRQHPWEVSL